MRRQPVAEHLLDALRQDPKLGHVVIDHIDRQLGDLIRSCADPFKGGSKVGIGLSDLGVEVRRQGAGAVRPALTRDEGDAGTGRCDDRRAVAKLRGIAKGWRIDDGQLLRSRGSRNSHADEASNKQVFECVLHVVLVPEV